MSAFNLSVNKQVADMLREAAILLRQQGANPFRVSAYRRAADTLDHLPTGVDEIMAQEGVAGLVALPEVGRGIAGTIHQILRTGRWSLLERLRGTLEPVKLFQTVPGIGPRLARRIHDMLDLDSLETLEAAAHDGRLARVPGVGKRRVEAIRAILSTMLGPLRRPRLGEEGGPPVEVLLEVDREYRSKVRTGRLPTISPRRFNPTGEAWLPILHTRREPWHFTALYSNTARAHDLGRTHDWVIIYYYDSDHHEGQYTVVTETRGPLEGRRVVRGREVECNHLYRSYRTPARDIA